MEKWELKWRHRWAARVVMRAAMALSSHSRMKIRITPSEISQFRVNMNQYFSFFYADNELPTQTWHFSRHLIQTTTSKKTCWKKTQSSSEIWQKGYGADSEVKKKMIDIYVITYFTRRPTPGVRGSTFSVHPFWFQKPRGWTWKEERREHMQPFASLKMLSIKRSTVTTPSLPERG